MVQAKNLGRALHAVPLRRQTLVAEAAAQSDFASQESVAGTVPRRHSGRKKRACCTRTKAILSVRALRNRTVQAKNLRRAQHAVPLPKRSSVCGALRDRTVLAKNLRRAQSRDDIRTQKRAWCDPTKANPCCGGGRAIELRFFVGGGLEGFGCDGGSVTF
jgi:hypothetical protein